ncbi:hypothetical protein [Clostridium neonatale]|nr:hypothetical protein [Clostridium neonatale]CAI3207855.1 hypothetical protein CNEO2_360061 [Clostridium neonatale]
MKKKFQGKKKPNTKEIFMLLSSVATFLTALVNLISTILTFYK